MLGYGTLGTTWAFWGIVTNESFNILHTNWSDIEDLSSEDSQDNLRRSGLYMLSLLTDARVKQMF